jgi:ABC-type phosphate transport system substrate-binding protein
LKIDYVGKKDIPRRSTNLFERQNRSKIGKGEQIQMSKIKPKAIVCSIIIAVLAVSMMAAIPVYALNNAGKLDVEGSSTVYPISQAAQPDFQSWTAAIAAPSSPPYAGYTFPFQATTLTLNNQGSGGGITAWEEGTIDIAASSKSGHDGGIFGATYPFTTASWSTSIVTDPEEFQIGYDSVAIIVNSANTWLTQAKASQIADAFVVTSAGGTTPKYATWGAWGAAEGISVPSAWQSQNIIHIGREFSSGTFDGFNTFFLKPFGFDMTWSAASNAPKAVWTTPDYQQLTSNQAVLTAMGQSANEYAIGFIALGMVQADIGSSHPDNVIPLAMVNSNNVAVQPLIANVKNNTYVSNEPSGDTTIIRALWYFMNGIPSANSADAVKSLWISFVKSNDAYLTSTGYLTMWRDDMASPTANAGNPNTSVGTQTVPDGVVDFNDLVYFASAWIAFYGPTHALNPYADITGPNGHPDGIIDFNDLVAFANGWIAYYATQ